MIFTYANLECCDIPVTITNIINSGRRTDSYVQNNRYIFFFKNLVQVHYEETEIET